MDEYVQIKKSLRKICRTDETERRPALFVAEVLAVDEAARTCEVGADGARWTGVRLRGLSKDEDTQMLVLPKVGSDIVVADVSADRTCLIAVGWTEIEGIKIDVGGENLARVLSDLVDEVAKIVVIVGTTPNVPVLQQIKQRINKILKSFS
jgi:hypothetical protein